MNNEEVIDSIASLVKSKFEREASGHDWWHIYRVWQLSREIALSEKANLFIVEIAALLHDIADWKFHNGNEKAGSIEAAKILSQLSIDQQTTLEVCTIIDEVSFKGAGVETPMSSLEGMIVQDADRLDAIGAIGIARTFAYGGHKGRQIYDPKINPEMHQTFESYKKSTAPTINHFYEKLLLLKDRINTTTARKIAHKRHEFMETYLKEFFDEWNCQL